MQARYATCCVAFLQEPVSRFFHYLTVSRWLHLFCFRVAHRSDNFIVGLSNVSPTVTAPTLGSYTVCGRYPGPVAAGATVYQRCDSCLPAYRYVIVQFESTQSANFCELEVYVRRKSISSLKNATQK